MERGSKSIEAPKNLWRYGINFLDTIYLEMAPYVKLFG
jgi:hypothetical protein